MEDCTLYDSTSHTGSDVTINVSLPSEFVITWQSIRKSNSSSINKLNIGADDNNMFQVGAYGSAGNNGLQERINGTWQTAQTTTNSPLNTTQNNTLTYSNGSLSYSNGSQTVSKTPTVSLDKLLSYGLQANGVLQNIKIKPL